MIVKDIQVFTDADLDGAISYLTLCWFMGHDLPVSVTTEKEAKKEIVEFIANNKVDAFRRVYVLDLDIGDFANILDYKNFSIVDHHLGSLNCNYNFKNAKTKLEDSGSTCKLLYKVLKTHYSKDLDFNKKLLISIGHDYDSYTLKDRETSIGINILFWNLQGDRLKKFVKKYKDGFFGFTEEDRRIINYYRNKINRFINESNIYTGTIKIGSKDIKFCSILADFCINEIAQEIIDRTKSEIAIVVNPRTESVSFRRNVGSTFNVAKLAEKIADGGGHPGASGGKITKTFLEFTKFLI